MYRDPTPRSPSGLRALTVRQYNTDQDFLRGITASRLSTPRGLGSAPAGVTPVLAAPSRKMPLRPDRLPSTYGHWPFHPD